MGAFLKKSPQAPKKLLSRDLLMGLANGDEIIRDTNEPVNKSFPVRFFATVLQQLIPCGINCTRK